MRVINEFVMYKKQGKSGKNRKINKKVLTAFKEAFYNTKHTYLNHTNM